MQCDKTRNEKFHEVLSLNMGCWTFTKMRRPAKVKRLYLQSNTAREMIMGSFER